MNILDEDEKMPKMTDEMKKRIGILKNPSIIQVPIVALDYFVKNGIITNYMKRDILKHIKMKMKQFYPFLLIDFNNTYYIPQNYTFFIVEWKKRSQEHSPIENEWKDTIFDELLPLIEESNNQIKDKIEM